MKKLKEYLMEFTGSLGDMGTFLPIACGLVAVNHVNGAGLFFTAGLFYILSGIFFRVPMPIQPLKATSALAMSAGASGTTISTVALCMSLFLFILVFSKLDKALTRLFTRPIIRGIQLGLAVILVKGGLKLILAPLAVKYVTQASASLDLYQAFFLLFLPQVPLTLANSIYASSDTANAYFKDRSSRVTPRALMLSLGLGNLVSGLCGSIPFCHGSSGITAHYRFGGRSHLCNIFSGALYLLVAAAFIFGAGGIIKLLPLWALGIALTYIGIRHGMLIRDIAPNIPELAVALFIGCYTLISGNLAAAFLIGISIESVKKGVNIFFRKNAVTFP